MVRFYIIPIQRTADNHRGPMYFKWRFNEAGIDCIWSMIDYGSIDMAVICADISQVDHDYLVLQPNVYSFPLDLDIIMNVSDRNALNTFLEAHAIPGDWLSPSDTFRSALRTVTCMMRYMMRVLAIIGYPPNPYSGITLNTQYKNVPNPLHDAMQQASTEQNYAWNVSPNDQIRKIFKYMSDQWASTSTIFGNLATL